MRPGAYKVHFAPCYSPFTPYPNVVAEYYDGASSFESAQTVNLTPGQTRNDIGASMQPGATISGHVDDSEGDDAEFVCVDAQPTGLSEPDGVDPFGPGFAATNASGNYTITGLKAGDYKLRLSDCSPFGVLDFDTEWWNNKASYAAADTVSVTAGGNSTGKDAVVGDTPVSGADISISNAAVTEGNRARPRRRSTSPWRAPLRRRSPSSTRPPTGQRPSPPTTRRSRARSRSRPATPQSRSPSDVKGDTVDEPNETFDVNLSSGVNATIADGNGVGTIKMTMARRRSRSTTRP